MGGRPAFPAFFFKLTTPWVPHPLPLLQRVGLIPFVAPYLTMSGLGYRVENRTTMAQALRTSLIQLFRQIE
jgi:hypothetical protein